VPQNNERVTSVSIVQRNIRFSNRISDKGELVAKKNSCNNLQQSYCEVYSSLLVILFEIKCV